MLMIPQTVFILALVLEFILGGIFVWALLRRSPSGDLKIYRDDPEDGPYLFLELDRGIPDIQRKKVVLLRVWAPPEKSPINGESLWNRVLESRK